MEIDFLVHLLLTLIRIALMENDSMGGYALAK